MNEMKRIITALLCMVVFAFSANAQTAMKKVYNEEINPLEQIDQAEDLLRPDSLYRPLILPQLDPLTKELEEWKEAPYEHFEKYQTNKVNRSVSGNSYRSKSEAFIASMLDQYHIPYHYEEVWDINGRLVAVDFTIRHPKTGQTFLWEHFGLLDDDGYVNDNLSKIYDYVKAGWIPMANLIVTCENKEQPLDFRLVHSLIKHFFIDG